MIPDQILAWSLSRPSWQRDALRRLFAQGALSAADGDELLQLCKLTAGLLDSGEHLQAVVLAAEHIGGQQTSVEKITLVSIANIQNTNALASGCTLALAPDGLTVVYGDNGAGKSGYARILKHACRARGASRAILPDVFDASAGSPSAEIAYTNGLSDALFTWGPSVPRPDELREISVFDSASAAVYVDEKTDVAFRPFGLDVFPKLVQACDKLRSALQAEVLALGSDRSFPELSGENPVGDAIRKLDTPNSEEKLRELSSLTEQELARCEDLRRQVAALDVDAPARRAAEGQLRLTRLRDFLGRLKRISSSVGTAAVSSLSELVQRLLVAVEAATKARADAAGFQSDWNVGSAAWQELWNSAKRFSESDLFPTKTFFDPEMNTDCVLCRQPLDAATTSRMQSFAAFASHEALQSEADASKALESAVSNLRQLAIELPEDVTILAEVAAESQETSESIKRFLVSASVLRDGIVSSVSEGMPQPTEVLSTESIDELSGICESVEKSVLELQIASEPAMATATRIEYAALQARLALQAALPEVLAEHKRRIRKKALAQAIRSTETAAITTKNTELTKAGISDQLRQRFQKELDRLELRHLTVSVEPQHGTKGVTYHQVRFTSAKSQGWNASDVLSEGEQRCIALAGFLAELSTQGTPSGAVLDDPVSSLDHSRRSLVAARIVEEAKARQVVVFTHDLVFLLCLEEESKQQSVAMESCYLTHVGAKRGVPMPGLPWYGQTLTKRVAWLRQAFQSLEAWAKTAERDEVDLRASTLWGRLREAWECGVEEVLLGGSVRRFSRTINTKQLRGVSDITPDDISAVDAGMTVCSTWMPGHDLSGAINQPMPALNVLKEEIEKLETWRKAIVSRRQAAS